MSSQLSEHLKLCINLIKQKEDEVTWAKIDKLFNSLRDDLVSSDDCIIFLDKCNELLCRSITSERSKLSGTSLSLLKRILEILGNETSIESKIQDSKIIYNLLGSILKICGRSNRVIYSRGHEFIEFFCKYIDTERYYKLFVESYNSCNKNIRLGVIKGIYSGNKLEKYKAIIEKGKTDPYLDIRNICKQNIIVNKQNINVDKQSEYNDKKVLQEVIKERIQEKTITDSPCKKMFKNNIECDKIQELEKSICELSKEKKSEIKTDKTLEAKIVKQENINNTQRSILKSSVSLLSNLRMNKLRYKYKPLDKPIKEPQDDLTPKKLDRYLSKYRTIYSEPRNIDNNVETYNLISVGVKKNEQERSNLLNESLDLNSTKKNEYANNKTNENKPELNRKYNTLESLNEDKDTIVMDSKMEVVINHDDNSGNTIREMCNSTGELVDHKMEIIDDYRNHLTDSKKNNKSDGELLMNVNKKMEIIDEDYCTEEDMNTLHANENTLREDIEINKYGISKMEVCSNIPCVDNTIINEDELQESFYGEIQNSNEILDSYHEGVDDLSKDLINLSLLEEEKKYNYTVINSDGTIIMNNLRNMTTPTQEVNGGGELDNQIEDVTNDELKDRSIHKTKSNEYSEERIFKNSNSVMENIQSAEQQADGLVNTDIPIINDTKQFGDCNKSDSVIFKDTNRFAPLLFADKEECVIYDINSDSPLFKEKANESTNKCKNSKDMSTANDNGTSMEEVKNTSISSSFLYSRNKDDNNSLEDFTQLDSVIYANKNTFFKEKE